MFYTVTLPCTLWFLDRGKEGTARRNQILFVDARHIYRKVDRAHRDWTEAQVGFLAGIVKLYRGEDFNSFLVSDPDDAREKLGEIFGKKLTYRDVPGLCKSVLIEEVGRQGWSLNPGRFVGVAPGDELSGDDFLDRIASLSEEFETLTSEARSLENAISQRFTEILE